VQVIEPREQGKSQRSKSGPDLDDMIVAARVDRSHDSLDDFRIDEKMLSEPLPRDVTASRHSG